ncbi:TPA: hypothetical protein DCF80_03320 [Candidatus Saccharibacteria bacterium]|nr:hypothetical protein [Candidatus Saccharibacteria bacterium]
MRPELINRFDAVVVFRALTRNEVGKIFDLLIEELRERLARKGLGITVGRSAKKWFIDRGYDAKNGARPLRRVIQNDLEHLIADGMLGDEYHKGDIIDVTVKRDTLQLEVIQEDSASVSASPAK